MADENREARLEIAECSTSQRPSNCILDERTRLVHFGLLLLILTTAAFLRLLYIYQPFVDSISWRQADDATIADNFFRGHLNIFLPEISWNGPGHNYVGYEFQLSTYLSALLYHLFGRVDWIGRGISIVFSLWGIFAFYNLVRRAFNEARALVGSAVFAIIPGGILADRSFIPDPLMISLVITSFWMLIGYLQTERTRYLSCAVMTGTLGALTKISGLIIGLPAFYVIIKLLPESGHARSRYIVRITLASILMLVPIVGYYVWALHIEFNYPPHHIAASNNWVWDEGLESWLRAGYFLHALLWNSRRLWGLPLLALVLLGLWFPPKQPEERKLRWLFHWWLLAGIIFYAVGARELVENSWNFHILDPALAGLAAQGLLIVWAALTACRLRLIGKLAAILVIVATHGFLGVRNLRWAYTAYAHQSYELGTALARISQPTDLVVTVANSIGDPVAIYYSQRRGWVFPPPWPGADWWEDIMDARWRSRLVLDRLEPNARAQAMRNVNPAFIPRNRLVEQALSAAIAYEDFSRFAALLTVLSRPYEDQEAFADYAKPPQTSERVFQTFCGT